MPDQRGNHHRIAQKFGVAAEDWMKHREVARDPAPSAESIRRRDCCQLELICMLSETSNAARGNRGMKPEKSKYKI
jgi:hypothetical protein